MFRSTRPHNPENDLLWKGAMCAAIGLLVLLGPSFMAPSPLQATVANSALVGWFALVLGCAFLVQYLVRRSKAALKNR